MHDVIEKKNNKIENSIRNALHIQNLHKSINKGRKATGLKDFSGKKKIKQTKTNRKEKVKPCNNKSSCCAL